MNCLRQERMPLAVLAALGLLAQVVVVTLSLALSPSSAQAFGMICQPSALELDDRTRATHDPGDCTCGPVCGHTAKVLATGAEDDLGLRHTVSLSARIFPFGLSAVLSVSASTGAIRAPPSALI